MDLSGIWRAQPADDELRRNGVGIDFDDSAWEHIAVPGHWRCTEAFADSDGPLLYRTHFDLPTPTEGTRTWVVTGGIFYQADVWLDGAYLGDPEGYFLPRAFDITGLARLGENHVLAVEVSCPAPNDPRSKRTLTGEFQGGRTFAPGWNPGGLWRPVEVITTGAVRIERCRVLCRDANDSRAHLRLTTRLDSDRACRATVLTRVDGEVLARQDHSLARGSNDLAWALDVANPKLWWPWGLGPQPLTEVSVEVIVEGVSSDVHRATTGLREVAIDDWIVSVNGERLFTKGVMVGPTQRDLASATPAVIRRDVELAREAGLDLIRVKGHVARPELYDAADELGMLVWQDMPLQGGYARSVRRQAVEQAQGMVDLLGHHPSIVLWCGHDTPESGHLGQQLPTWNKTILDRWVKRAIERVDESRPVVAHSGVEPHLPLVEGTDTNLRFGWGNGWGAGDLGELAGFAARFPSMVRFVSGFGSQSVSDSAGFIDRSAWPRLDWEALAIEHGLDAELIQRAAPPQQFRTFAEWAVATQRYQAEVLRHHIETLRRLKYRPTGGFCLASLADATPMISTAILDHERSHKLAFNSVTDACRPVIVVADRPGPELVAGSEVALEVHIVNDLRDPLDSLNCTAMASWPGGGRTWQWSGNVDADACARIGVVRFTVPDAPGSWVLDLTIDHAEGVATNRYEATIVR